MCLIPISVVDHCQETVVNAHNMVCVMWDGDAIVPQRCDDTELCFWSPSNSMPAYLTSFHRSLMALTLKRKERGDNVKAVHLML